MATASPSPIFSSLTGIWSLLALRSDIDDIILELLGRFSLEKVYADADKESYADLILTLLVQLRVIFFIQRLTLPPGGTIPVDWSLGFLVSWEVTVRTVEFGTLHCATNISRGWCYRPCRFFCCTRRPRPTLGSEIVETDSRGSTGLWKECATIIPIPVHLFSQSVGQSQTLFAPNRMLCRFPRG